jgi:acetyl-CoA acetyltransferase
VSAADREPVIIGAHDGPSGRTGRSGTELYLLGGLGALADAGLTVADADAVLTSYSWEDPRLMHADDIAEELGVRARYTETVCLGGASPVGMVGRAARAIADGVCDVAVLASGSNRASGMGRGAAIDALREVAHPRYELPYGVFVPALYALVAQRYLYDSGGKPEQLAAVAVAQRAWSAAMPGAAMTAPLTVHQARATKLISHPLTMVDCCLVTDFSAGLVMTTAARARELGRAAVPVLGYGEHHGAATVAQAEQLTSFGARAAGATAFARAGRAPSEVDFAQLYDCFTITVLVTMEDLGLCDRGTAGAFVEAGQTGPGGDLPVNTNGGMLSYATGGMYHVTEAVRQLRREAGPRQLERTGLAVVNGVGGVFSANCTAVLGEPT